MYLYYCYEKQDEVVDRQTDRKKETDQNNEFYF